MRLRFNFKFCQLNYARPTSLTPLERVYKFVYPMKMVKNPIEYRQRKCQFIPVDLRVLV